MSTERIERWVKASQGVGRIEAFMIVVVQGLGRVDSKLIEEYRLWMEQSDNSDNAAIAKSIKLTDLFTLSYLWVLGAYELIRTISERCQEEMEILGDELSQRVIELK